MCKCTTLSAKIHSLSKFYKKTFITKINQNDRGKRLSNLEILEAYFMLQIYRTPFDTLEHIAPQTQHFHIVAKQCKTQKNE